MQHSLIMVGLALGLVCSVWGRPASAVEAAPESEPASGTTDERSRIVLVVGPELEELTRRFMAELASMHFDVVHVHASVVPVVGELDELALQHAAQIAVRVSRAGNAVDLWVLNPKSGEVIYRRLAADGDPAVLVLRSLEILRGALVDLHVLSFERDAQAPAAERDVSSPANEAQPARPARPLWLGISTSLLAARAGRDLGGGAMLGLYRGLGSHFALHGEVFVAFSEWSVEGEGGRARVRPGAATVGALVLPWGEGTFAPGLGVGVGVLALHTRGEARSGYRATTDLNFAAFPHGRLELGIGLSASIRLRTAFFAGFATPRPVLLFADQRADDWLNPVWVSSLGVEVALR